MKLLCTMFIMLSIFNAVSCTDDDDDCVWNYKCCVFKETKAGVTCEKMCEPEIVCEPLKTDNDEAEVFDPYAPLEIKSSVCREGFQFKFGKCRKVLKLTRRN